MKYYVTPCGNKIMLLQPVDGEAPALQAVLYSDYAKLEAELATAKQQRDGFYEQWENAEQRAAKMADERDRLEQENKRLKAPVSDEEWSDWARFASMDEGRHYDSMIDRECFDSIIAARTEQEKGEK